MILLWLIECLIVRINHHLCRDRGYGLVDTSVQKLCTNRILQIISDISTTHRRADRHRRRRIFRIQTTELIHRSVNHADLRAVAVRDDHLIVLTDKISDRLCRALRSFLLLRQCRSQCVMSQCNNDLLFSSFLSSSNAFMRAFVIPFPCIHQKILPVLFYHEPSVMRNGQLVTEALKFAAPERKKREPHTRFSYVRFPPCVF